ncbi:MAG: DUF6677 family protein [Planctomycetota bacterium]
MPPPPRRRPEMRPASTTPDVAVQDRDTGSKPSAKTKPGHVEVNPEVFNGETVIEIDGQQIDLQNRFLAALLAWLIPGAGHFYQGRRTKATLFLVSILSIWVLGFALGGGHVVYASWQPGDKRWHYLLQAGVGAAALPAIMQNRQLNAATDPRTGQTLPTYEPGWGGFMAPPRRPVLEGEPDEVAAWYARRGSGYELGTWYTVIAGLLNLLVIYDAYGGPLSVPISGRRKRAPEGAASS